MILTNLTDKHIATHLKESGISNFRIIGKVRTMSVTLLNELHSVFPDRDFYIVSDNELRMNKRNDVLGEMKTYEI